MTLGDGFTGPMVLAADVHEVGILGEKPREGDAIGIVPRPLEIFHDIFATI